MNKEEFERDVRAQGYHEVVDRWMEANTLNPDHAHEFDARLLVLEGQMTVICGDEERTYRTGDAFAMTAGRRHSERSGPEGVRYLAGRRYTQHATG